MQHLDPAPAELDPEAELVVVRPTPERTSPPRSERQHAWGSPRSVEMSPPSQRSPRPMPRSSELFSPRGPNPWDVPRSGYSSRQLGLVAPIKSPRPLELDVASLMSLDSAPQYMVVVPAPSDKADKPHAVAVHSECDPSSEDSVLVRESLPQGCLVHVLDTYEMPDGQRRAQIVLKGDVAPLGWLTTALMDGTPFLQPVFARPSYEVVKAATVRQRFQLTSPVVGTVPVGARLHVVDVRKTADGTQRCSIVLQGDDAPIGWITQRKPDQRGEFGTTTIREIGEDGKVRPPPKALPKFAYEVPHFVKPAEEEALFKKALKGKVPKCSRKIERRDGSPEGDGATGPRALGGRSRSGSLSGGSSRMEKMLAAQRAAQGQQSGAEDDGAKAPIPTNMPSDFKLRPVPELEAARDDYYRKASKEEEALSSKGASLSVRLGKELMARQTKVAELVASWAKRGEEPISKMEFRQQVRKYLETKDEKAEKGAKAEKIDIKEVDTLFESLDKDNSGTIGVPELRGAFKKLQDAASHARKNSDAIREKADKLRERAKLAKDAGDATKIMDATARELATVRDKKSMEARLGSLLSLRAVKVNEVVGKWAKQGAIDLGGFKTNIRILGMKAEDEELESMFNSLNTGARQAAITEAGFAGRIPINELIDAMSKMQDQQKNAVAMGTKLEKQLAELTKAARTVQWKFRRQQLLDEREAEEAAEEEAKRQAAEAAEAEAKRQAKLAALEEKRLAAEAAAAEFEAKVSARRSK